MNLFNLKATILQAMPPHWRKEHWKTAMAYTLLFSLENLYNKIILHRYFLEKEIGVIPQTIVIENLLQQKIYANKNNLFIANDTNIPSKFLVYLSQKHEDKKYVVEQILMRYKPLGTFYEIILF